MDKPVIDIVVRKCHKCPFHFIKKEERINLIITPEKRYCVHPKLSKLSDGVIPYIDYNRIPSFCPLNDWTITYRTAGKTWNTHLG